MGMRCFCAQAQKQVDKSEIYLAISSLNCPYLKNRKAKQSEIPEPFRGTSFLKFRFLCHITSKTLTCRYLKNRKRICDPCY